MTITVKSKNNFIISDMINGRRCHMEYLYYSRRESIKKFKEDFKEEYELENEGLLDLEGFNE